MKVTVTGQVQVASHWVFFSNGYERWHREVQVLCMFYFMNFIPCVRSTAVILPAQPGPPVAGMVLERVRVRTMVVSRSL